MASFLLGLSECAQPNQRRPEVHTFTHTTLGHRLLMVSSSATVL